MVWFQCEDCGENLKKPKLASHFRQCSARKLSCIDCGVVFNQQSVQSHTQCVTEAEKYGPKNDGNVSIVKLKSRDAGSNVVDLCIGLSSSAPWSCSLCNVKATSQESLALHAQGKKHKSKARAATARLTESLRDHLAHKAEGAGAAENIEPPAIPRDKSYSSEGYSNGLEEQGPNEQNGHTTALPEFQDLHKVKDGKHKRQREEDEVIHARVLLVDKGALQPLFDQVTHTGHAEVPSNGKRRKATVKNVFKTEESRNDLGGVRKNGDISIVTAQTSPSKKKEAFPGKVAAYWQGQMSETQTAKESGFGSERINVPSDAPKSRKKKAAQEIRCSTTEDTLISSLDGEYTKGSQEMENNKNRESLALSANAEGLCSSTSSLLLAVKWIKLIKKALKKSPDGSLRKKDLCKAVLPLVLQKLESAGLAADRATLQRELDNQICSSSKFIADGKVIRLSSRSKDE